MDFTDFLSFRNMVTPLIIQVIYFIALAVNALLAIVTFFRGMFYGFSGFLIGAIVALIMLLVGSLVIRVYCELLILAFKIYDELKAIRTGAPPPGDQQGFPVTPTAPMPTTPGAPAATPPEGGLPPVSMS
jgi:hypothetical protein